MKKYIISIRRVVQFPVELPDDDAVPVTVLGEDMFNIHSKDGVVAVVKGEDLVAVDRVADEPRISLVGQRPS